MLSSVSVDVPAGMVIGVLGANGVGKSTLLSVMAGEMGANPALHVHCPVQVNGCDIVDLSVAQLARHRAVLPQNPGLAFDLAVEEVICMGRYPFPELSDAALQGVLEAAIVTAGVAPLQGRRYLELSGGEQQRVQFARVLVQVLAAAHLGSHACYLLLDEPTSNLDPAHQHGLLRAAREVARDAHAGVLVVLHDVNLAAQYCDRLALLADGGVLECGEPSAVLRPELLQRVYGVHAHVQPHPVLPHLPLVVFL